MCVEKSRYVNITVFKNLTPGYNSIAINFSYIKLFRKFFCKEMISILRQLNQYFLIYKGENWKGCWNLN